MHIGLIGGMGPVATGFYYEQIVQAFANAGQQLHLTIAHTSVLELSRNVAANRVNEQVNEFARVTAQLASPTRRFMSKPLLPLQWPRPEAYQGDRCMIIAK